MRLTVCALAATLLAGTCLAPSARAELVYQGSIHSHEASIRKVYEKLPPRGKDVSASVAEVPSSDWARQLQIDDPDTVGVYDDRTREIFVKSDESDLDVTFAHEFGHHVYYSTFSKREKRDWNQFWKLHRREMPGEDCKEDPTEAFAECYAYVFIAGKEKLSPEIQDRIRTYFAAPSQARIPHKKMMG